MGKVLQNKLQKQTALLDSAYELFTTVGFSKTTIRDIAHKAGVAKGTFYLYFNDKIEIRDALVRAKASQLLQDACASMDSYLAESSASMDTADKFIYIINYLIDVVSEDINFLKFMSKHLSWGLFTGNHHTVQYHDSKDAPPVIDFIEYIDSMLRKDNVIIRDSKILLFTLLELVSSSYYDVILYSEPLPLEEFRPHLNRTIRLIVNDAIEN
jgi:AcrR family transcriptional regulator